MAVAIVGAIVAGAGSVRAADADPATPLDLPDDVTVGIEYPRYLQPTRGGFEVTIDNQSNGDLHVTELRLLSPLFEEQDPTAVDVTIRAGLRNDLRVPFGPSVCPPADRPTQVSMTIEADGVTQHGVVEIDPEPVASVNRTECGALEVAEHADIAFADEYTIDDETDTLYATVIVTRRAGDDPITIDTVRGTVLYRLKPWQPLAEGDVMATLEPGESSIEVPVVLLAARCEPHAVADVKKPYDMAIWITVGNGEETYIPLRPSDPVIAGLQELTRRCVADTPPARNSAGVKIGLGEIFDGELVDQAYTNRVRSVHAVATLAVASSVGLRSSRDSSAARASSSSEAPSSIGFASSSGIRSTEPTPATDPIELGGSTGNRAQTRRLSG